jgi:uncharacterized membrane protein
VVAVFYVSTIMLVVIGLLVLAVVLVRLLRVVHRLTQTMSTTVTNTRDRAGLLRARYAAVRVAVTRRHPPETQ